MLSSPADRTSSTASVPLTPASESQTSADRGASTSNGTAKSLDELQQRVKDLEAARQDLTQRLDNTKRQLSEAEGDIKLMSQQLGALSERVDGLAGSRASMPKGTDANQRRRAKSR